MFKKLFQLPSRLVAKTDPNSFWYPLLSAIDAFCFEPPEKNLKPPFIKDAVDVKRWMILVIFALLPCIVMAIWNSGMQKYIYTSGSLELFERYRQASLSFKGYFAFALQKDVFFSVLRLGLGAFLPLMLISYLVGGITEACIAGIRKHPIAEGFLVTGMLYPLILPSTIPYWIAAFGIMAGIILSKEVFGGTGMNIVNPAITCRALLYFTFPGKMSGDIWVGTNLTHVKNSLETLHRQAGIDTITTASPLSKLNSASLEIKRIHVDAIAEKLFGKQTLSHTLLEKLETFKQITDPTSLKAFVTSTLSLDPDTYQSAVELAKLSYGTELYSNANLFFGNMIGSLGETSVFACLLGALFLLCVGIASYRSMLGVLIGAFVTALGFQMMAVYTGGSMSVLHTAKYALPAYKHLLLGGLAFGLVFMATDPVSSPDQKLSQWIYGLFIGVVTILIRLVNPAYPEGVMLAILLGNIFAPLIDYYVLRKQRRTLGVKLEKSF